MKNMKGFTLVELLAVIVILAVVALITSPIILNVINNSRQSGAQDKAWGTIEAVKLAFSEAQYGNTSLTLPLKHDFSSGATNSLTVKVSGDKPTSGKVQITSEGKIVCKDLKFENQGTYYCTSNTTGTKVCCNTSQVNSCS